MPPPDAMPNADFDLWTVVAGAVIGVLFLLAMFALSWARGGKRDGRDRDR